MIHRHWYRTVSVKWHSKSKRNKIFTDILCFWFCFHIHCNRKNKGLSRRHKKCFAKRITVSKYSSFLIQICSINLSTNKISLPYVLLIAKGYSGDTTGLMLKVVTVIFTHDYKLYVYFCSLNVSNLKRQAVAQDEKEFEGISHSN